MRLVTLTTFLTELAHCQNYVVKTKEKRNKKVNACVSWTRRAAADAPTLARRCGGAAAVRELTLAPSPRPASLPPRVLTRPRPASVLSRTHAHIASPAGRRERTHMQLASERAHTQLAS